MVQIQNRPANVTSDTDFVFNNGQKVPAIGLGTFQSKPEEVSHAVSFALKQGYRHIDGAAVYANENDVGRGIKESGVSREKLYIVSKLWNTQHQNVAAACQQTLDDLGLDYLDLYLLHWPVAFNPHGNHKYEPKLEDGSVDIIPGSGEPEHLAKVYKEMEKLLKSGKVKSIGVSNFSIKKLEKFLPLVDVVPVTNQVELHPQLPQWDLKEYCESKGIILTAYAPLGQAGELLQLPVVKKIAEKHNTGVGNVVISWNIKRGVITIPKSVKDERIKSNFVVANLDEDDMKDINQIGKDKPHRYSSPPYGKGLGFPDYDGAGVRAAA